MGVVRCERGSVLVTVAVSILVLFGFAALAVDGGYLYSKHTRLQDIDDSMALAAGYGIGQTSGRNDTQKMRNAFQEAVEYAQKNNLSVSNIDNSAYTANISSGTENGQMVVSFPNGMNEVKVDVSLNSNLFFAKALGKSSTPVSVTATAKVGGAGRQTGGLLPIGIVTDDPLNSDDDWVTGQHFDMTLGPSFGSQGNYGYLDFQPPSSFGDYIEYGYDQTLEVGDTVNTYTGVSAGLVANNLSDRIGSDTCTLANYKDHEDCPRLVYVPIVDRVGDTGSSTVQITGFAAFFIEGFVHVGDNITISGEFVARVSPEEISPSYLGYQLASVRLIH